MKFLYPFIVSLSFCTVTFSQPVSDTISQEYVEQTITWLASDYLEGRVNYTPRQLEAAEFLEKEFDRFGLQPYPGLQGFYQPFNTKAGGSAKKDSVMWNGQKLDDRDYAYFTQQFSGEKKTLSDFFVLRSELPLPDSILFRVWHNSNDVLLWIPVTEANDLATITKNILVPPGKSVADILVVAAKDEPVAIELSGKSKLVPSSLYNVIGVLPGKSKAGEYVIFSAHYDHVPEGLSGERGIHNGANDNASGTTAVLALANYFSIRADNERSILFCLFAGEELGLQGSKAFVPYVNPEKIVAMINIEMIGRTNVVGRNSFFLTGPSHSNLYRIMKSTLKAEGSRVRVSGLNNDPRNLFQRSDNYPFALRGIPAHTVMCSDDMEDCYHRPCDDVKLIHIENMTVVIRGIAKACGMIISGKETPDRIR